MRFLFSCGMSFVIFAVSVLCFGSTPAAYAATPAGLIKGSGPVIFYLASNGRRYAFPNEQTFRTWYQDFSGVRTVSEQELAKYTYGGNVTYRPGTRLLQRVGDSKIYTVGRGGMLRWITSPQVAQVFYGSNWRRLVDKLPEARVADYVFGEPVRSTQGVSPATERQQTPTIEQNRRLSSSVVAVPVSAVDPAASTRALTSVPIVPSVSPSRVSTPSVPSPVRTAPAAPVIWPGQVRLPSSPSTQVSSTPSPSVGGSSSIAPVADLSLYPGGQRFVPVGTEAALRTAFQNARAGDVIAITGSYSLTRRLTLEARGTIDHPVYVVAAHGRGSARFTVSGDEALMINGARYVIIDGLLINRTGGHGIEVQGQSDYITLRNLSISDAGLDGDLVNIHQASHITIEASDLARPGRRSDTSENGWQEAIEVADASQVVIHRNWIHDVGNMAGMIRAGSSYVRVEQNLIDSQRSGSGADPVWGIGGWTDDSSLTHSIAYEAVGTVFERNVVAHAVYGALSVSDARDTSIINNLFLNNAAVILQLRAGNGSEQVSDGLRLTSNHFVDTRGTMPNLCEVQGHDVRAFSAADNSYWNNRLPIPSESDCGFVPSMETGAVLDTSGISDVTVTSYEAAMALVDRS